ncbi:MAG: TraR/DksA family transcriptional regulator [Rhodobacteraceae bacterium]|jgi:DnaK suppressor protein|nr:TraR/DksA family transcriptional regulator [Alphaproteobacteria bacterium]NNF72869.1 TraR/DksA family transcriptional regulator [Paracoccaceae bacterium]NNK68590.1 TraR/DksA family transcriptional regulator [Paracoccaceae bacterium]
MPTPAEIETFQTRLLAELAALETGDDLGQDGQKTVTLDQQSVGRLSRMDALQQQAMAQATARRRATRRQRITAALARIDEGEYGYCTDCGDEIAPARLDLDPTAPMCLSCTRG